MNSRRRMIALAREARERLALEPSTRFGAKCHIDRLNKLLMSALGQKRTLCSAKRHVRFTPESGHVRRALGMSALCQ